MNILGDRPHTYFFHTSSLSSQAGDHSDHKLMCGDSLISTIHGERLIPDSTKNQQTMLAVTPVQTAIQPLVDIKSRTTFSLMASLYGLSAAKMKNLTFLDKIYCKRLKRKIKKMKWQPKPKIITQKVPNQHVFLYQDFAELINNDQIVEGKAFVKISWHPSPNVNFKFVYSGEDRIDTANQDKLELKLTELVPQHRLRVHISSSTHWGNKKNQLTGHLIEPFFKGITNNLASVVFHISNFWCFNISNHFDDEEDKEGNLVEIEREGWLIFDGQFIFDYDKWHIVLSTLDNSYELQEFLESEGGYGVTHICKIERLDNTIFTLEEAYEIIEAFSYYLSFVRGIWIAPLLVSGFDSEGNQLLEEWRNPIIKGDSWQHGNRWTYLDSTEIVAPFAGFMKKWQDPIWKEVIQNAIQWYIESLKHFNGYNTSIILLQAALEKIAWTFLKVDEYVIPDGFNGLKASGQIRLLLKILNVRLEPIEEYIEIQKKVKELNWNDSIVAITEVRNSIVHPSIKSNKPQVLSEKIRQEAFRISNTYLLKCLLKLFEYGYSID